MLIICAVPCATSHAADKTAPVNYTADETAAERGFRWLTTKAYLPADFDQDVFDSLWRVWPHPLREKAQNASPTERRRMAFSRYGLMERPTAKSVPDALSVRDTTLQTALGYVDDGNRGWAMNCLACHTGKVRGEVVLGVPNSHYALHTLTEDVRLVKLQQGKPLGHMELGSIKIPLGQTIGTTNAVMFGVAVGSARDKDLNVRRDNPATFIHHDMDAPPFWNVKKKTHIYADAFVPRSHRPLIQFVMLPKNDAATLKSWEPDFKDILAWIELLDPPKYPYPVTNRDLVARGKTAFEKTCARCHGTYGENETYPNKVVPLEIVNTDPVRLHSLTREYRQAMSDGWIGEYGAKPNVVEPVGYIAPPLDGIWASAPYLHNGSVPTLWHLLHPVARPTVWQRTEDGYDSTRVGLEMTTFDELPATVKSTSDRRTYFDTRLPGKSAAGHNFPDELTEDEKAAVLEYLKTL